MRKGLKVEGDGKGEAQKSRWALFFKNTHHLPSGPHWTEKPEYHLSYATQLNQLRPPCRRITRNIFIWGDHPGGHVSEIGKRFSVLVGSVGEVTIISKKFWVLNVWTGVQGLKFWVKIWYIRVRESVKCLKTNSKAADNVGIPLHNL